MTELAPAMMAVIAASGVSSAGLAIFGLYTPKPLRGRGEAVRDALASTPPPQDEPPEFAELLGRIDQGARA